MSGLRVLVCGGRGYTDEHKVRHALRYLHTLDPIARIYHGGARGADKLAGEWAHDAGIPVTVFPADWDKHGRAAGPLRNAEMIKAADPHIVIAFPGGRGTGDMVARAFLWGAEVWRPAIETYGGCSRRRTP